MEFLQSFPAVQNIVGQAALYLPKILLALVVLYIGLKIIGLITNSIQKKLEKSEIDPTLSKFFSNLLGWVLKAMLFISVASMVGVETTSFIAVIGAASLAVGLSLQGALSNFAGGMLIMIFRPYKVGDLIESQGHLGGVKAIQVFNTILVNTQNHTIILPNGAVAGGDIKNYSTTGMMRVDTTVGIDYGSNIKVAKEALLKMMNDHPKVLKEPAPEVGVIELADSSVNLTVRPWCVPEDYWQMQLDIMEGSKLALDEAGISIPFPQMDVHLDK